MLQAFFPVNLGQGSNSPLKQKMISIITRKNIIHYSLRGAEWGLNRMGVLSSLCHFWVTLGYPLPLTIGGNNFFIIAIAPGTHYAIPIKIDLQNGNTKLSRKLWNLLVL